MSVIKVENDKFIVEIPNIDSLSENELYDAMEDFYSVSSVMKNLAGYTEMKLLVQELRLKGEISEAKDYEKVMERIYDLLPAWAKW